MGLFSRLSYISRKKKLDLFYEVINPSEQMRVLDVGAEINPNGDRGLQLIDSYPWKKNISAVNISRECVSDIKHSYPEIDARLGDACSLPWPDGYFDAVYCNAVIEHVGDFENQKKMASEVMRVGKRWFVSTPNRWYPFEFHLRLPFVTWLPGHSYLRIGRLIGYDHVQQRYVFGADHSGTRLMTAKELKRCFLTSRIIKQRVTFMAETLVVVGGDI
jgi:2-polyprenyl-3-methyl-5-hydroxy-6-metoxy-1,4-benzoquinol methylase